MRQAIHKKAWLSTGVMWLLGGGIMGLSQQYDVGSLRAMGPGFMPYYCGLLMLILGFIYLIASYVIPTEKDFKEISFTRSRLRGWFFIFLGMSAFVYLGDRLGFVPASFALVFISSIGSSEFKLRHALALSSAITLIGSFIFLYLLDLQIPLFTANF